MALLDDRPVHGAHVDPLPRLVIEIMQSSADRDLREKRLRYAQAGVPEYWVVDLTRRLIHVFRDPERQAANADVAWRDVVVAKPGDALSPLCIPSLDLDVTDVLPTSGTPVE